MYLLAHAGITVGAACVLEKAVNCRRVNGGTAAGTGSVPPARQSLHVDYRFILLGSLLPDIIDKPLGYILLPGVLANGRTFLHTLLFLVLILLASYIIYRRQGKLWGFYITFGVLMHFIMDAIWADPVTLFWPFLGSFSTRPGVTFPFILQSWTRSFFAEPRIYILEAAGFLILLFFSARLVIHKKMMPFIMQGRLL